MYKAKHDLAVLLYGNFLDWDDQHEFTAGWCFTPHDVDTVIDNITLRIGNQDVNRLSAEADELMMTIALCRQLSGEIVVAVSNFRFSNRDTLFI